jgi:hypothetical protein
VIVEMTTRTPTTSVLTDPPPDAVWNARVLKRISPRPGAPGPEPMMSRAHPEANTSAMSAGGTIAASAREIR